MSTEIEPFNPKQFADRLQTVVREQMGMLIPPEQLEKYVQKEIKAFFEDDGEVFIFSRETKDWDRKATDQIQAKVSPFRLMVWKLMVEYVKPKLEEMKHSEGFLIPMTTTYNNNGGSQLVPTLTAQQEERLKDALPEIGVKLFQGLFAEAHNNASMTVFNAVEQALQNKGIR